MGGERTPKCAFDSCLFAVNMLRGKTGQRDRVK